MHTHITTYTKNQVVLQWLLNESSTALFISCNAQPFHNLYLCIISCMSHVLLYQVNNLPSNFVQLVDILYTKSKNL